MSTGLALPLGAFFQAQPNHKLNALYIAGCLFAGGLFIALLTQTPKRFRKPLIVSATFIAGLYFSLEFLLPPKATAETVLASHSPWNRTMSALFGWFLRPLASNSRLAPDENWLSLYLENVNTVWQVIGAFTFALGLWNLIHLHFRNVVHVTKGAFASSFFFLGLAFMIFAGYLKQFSGIPDLFAFATSGLFFQLDAAMFSLIAFFIISAAYRAFRIRSFEASIMMAAALLVMLSQIPVGAWLTSWLPDHGLLSNLRIERVGQWVLRQPNAAAQRGINFGLAVGMLATGLRIWLSLERGSYFERDV
ncbi:MAG: hypothetical protein IT209_06295 [Armatimonadetes bacterium]|nr:hypothetical protein [Armatimonadota bacterium]